MADFSLTTLFVAPVGQTELPSTGSTQDLTPGQLGVFLKNYAPATSGNIAASPHFYVAQGRSNTYLQGSKRSDKIKGGANGNILEWYKVVGNPTAVNQITEVSNIEVKPGDSVTLTIRAHSSYLETLYFNGWTKSVTLPESCIECGADPCDTLDPEDVVDALLVALGMPVNNPNPDNTGFETYFTFSKVGTGATTKLVIEGKPLTKYGLPCDVSAYPHEYDRMWFEVFFYVGPDTTADFITSDACNVAASVDRVQTSNFPSGTSEEIEQLEINFHSYQAGYLKHLYKMVGYNQNFESHVTPGTVYTTYYIKFNDLDRHGQNWTDYVSMDSTVIIAVPSGGALEPLLEAVLVASLGAVTADNTVVTTTTTTTV